MKKTEFQRLYDFLRRRWLDRNIDMGITKRAGFNKSLAQTMGLSQSRVSQLKNSQGEPHISADTWLMMSASFSVDVSELIRIAAGKP